MKTRRETNKLLIFNPLYPPHIGGLQNHAATFDRGLAQLGYTLTVFTPMVTPAKPLEQHHNLQIIRYPAFELIPNYPVPQFWRPLFWRLYLNALQTPTDIVISRTRFFFSSLLALFTAWLKKKPLIHIEHGSDYVHLKQPLLTALARSYDKTFGRLVLARAHCVVAISQAAANFVQALAHRQPETIIYRGVDHQAISLIKPNQLIPSLYTGRVIVVYRGRLITGKGVHILLAALACIKDLPINCLLVGDGPQAKALKQQTRDLHIGSIVTFVGAVPWTESIALLKAADIVVNPSFTEGLPTAVIEAALAGRAIIATNVGGTGEIVTDNISALLIPKNNPLLLATMIKKLVADPAQRKILGSAAYRHNQGRFNWADTLTQYGMLFASL